MCSDSGSPQVWRRASAFAEFIKLISLFSMMASGDVARAGVQMLIVPNGSFEDPAMPDGLYRWTETDGDLKTIPSWTYNATGSGAGHGGVQNAINPEFPGTTGSPGLLRQPALDVQYGWLNVDSLTTLTASFTSVSIVTIQPSSRYRLTVAIGDRLDEEPSEVGIALLADNNPIAGAQSWILGSQLSEGEFADLSTSFDVLGPGDPLIGKSLQVQLIHRRALGAQGTSFQADYDNVRLEAEAVPEPVSVVMLLIAGVMRLAALRSR